jgi:catechol 2,3-dioxygenase-like lactoylglutathione lyase family enzyme
MGCDLVAVCFDAIDPPRLVEFWAGVLGWEAAGDSTAAALQPADDTGFQVRFRHSEVPKTVQNLRHFDLTSTSLDDQASTVARSLALGARHVDIGQSPQEAHVVLADPEGNEFCVIEPGNAFLADCGLVGALACDGSQQVGYFWSQALGWPLVWDQDEETAIRSPHGGPKITWGGPPLMPRAGADRVRLDLAPPVGAAARAEVDRLLALGAHRVDVGHGDADPVVLADPDGNEFRVLPG